jgi:predicted nucleic acid-binding protein
VRLSILAINTITAQPHCQTEDRCDLVTTDEILTEFLDGLADRRPALENSEVTPQRQTHESFLAALELYRHRPDKGYSLVDCVSMNSMRRWGLTEILTNDRHFTQKGFRILLG